MTAIPAIHQSIIDDDPELFGREDDWLDMMLSLGLKAPADSLPGLQWYMPGSMWGECFNDWEYTPGPAKARDNPYMVVSVGPSYGDYRQRKHLRSDVGRILSESLEQAGFEKDEVYLTTVTRFPKPANSSSWKQKWLKAGWEYLDEEIRRVKPRAILFLGSEPTKMAFGNKTKLDHVRGQVMDYKGIKSTAAVSHLSFITNTAGLPSFVKQLRFFRQLGIDNSLQGQDGLEYPDRDYQVLDTPEKIEQAVAAELASGHKWLTVDVETGNDTGRPYHDYVITFQWSHGPKHACVIPLYVERPEPMVPQLWTKGERKGQPVINEETGEPVMVPKFGGAGVDQKSEEDKVPHYDQAVDAIRRLMAHRGFSWVGHNVREDLKWCRDSFGIPIRPIIMEGRVWDTMLAHHIMAKDDYGLKQLVLRFTDMGAYEAPMHQWIVDNGGPGKLFPGNEDDRFFHAYRDVPYRYLLPYACCDVDGTYRVFEKLYAELHRPENDELRLLYYEIELPSQHGIIDIESNGVPADPDRLWELHDLYVGRREEMTNELREIIGWEDFNPNSTREVNALLYHGPYKDWEKGEERRPDTCEPLGLTPILTTGKYPKKWKQVVDDGHELYESPSAANDTLVTLLATYDMPERSRDIIDRLRQIGGIKNFISNFLQAPKHTDLTGPEFSVYGKGLLSCINDRGHVCCRISTLSETGRWRHFKPNLANLPKNKESSAQEVFDFKVPKVRSGFKAKPGWVLMEADYSSAELFVMGYFSGDQAFIKVLESGHDVHGYNAVNVFGLDCHPNEVKTKYPERRAAVKTLVFGMAYGLSVTGLSEKLSVELKRLVTRDEAQEIIDQFFSTYPVLKQFFESKKQDVETLSYVSTMYGRRRYFPGVSRLGREQLAAAKREAMNAPIQGTVADMLNVALINLDRMRYETEVGMEIGWEVMVGIHDALLVHVKEEYAQVMADILKVTMSDMVPLPKTDGITLRVDVECGQRWGEFEDVEKYLKTQAA